MTITNTLENAKLLEKLGLSAEQAQGVSEIVETAAQAAQPDLSQLVTKDFLRAEFEKFRREFDVKFGEFRAEIDVKFGEFRAEFDLKFGEFRAEFDVKLEKLRVDFGRDLRQQMLWFFAMQVTIVATAFTLFKIVG